MTRAVPARTLAALAVGALLAGLAAANYHLVSVATRSQPDCVLRPATEGGAAHYRAAKPSC